MSKKARSKPMKEILSRIATYHEQLEVSEKLYLVSVSFLGRIFLRVL